ncbi:MAG: DUF4417 domain-containing protein, partial [Akkermansia sp.]
MRRSSTTQWPGVASTAETLSWSVKSSYPFCFDGIPHNATVAVSTVGVKGNKAALEGAEMFDAINR